MRSDLTFLSYIV